MRPFGKFLHVTLRPLVCARDDMRCSRASLPARTTVTAPYRSIGRGAGSPALHKIQPIEGHVAATIVSWPGQRCPTFRSLWPLRVPVRASLPQVAKGGLSAIKMKESPSRATASAINDGQGVYCWKNLLVSIVRVRHQLSEFVRETERSGGTTWHWIVLPRKRNPANSRVVELFIIPINDIYSNPSSVDPHSN